MKARTKAIAIATATSLYFTDDLLSVDGDTLATKDEYLLADRCWGSVFEALEPCERIALSEGIFELDSELDPILLFEYDTDEAFNA